MKQRGRVGMGILVILSMAVILAVLWFVLSFAMTWGCGLRWGD